MVPRVARACSDAIPRMPSCNVARCIDGLWQPWPVDKGTSCAVPSFGQGNCDGGVIINGQIEANDIGRCGLTETYDKSFSIAAVWYAAPGTGSYTVYSNTSQTGSTLAVSGGTANSFTFDIASSLDFIGLTGGTWNVGYTQTWSKNSTTTTDFLLTYRTDYQVPSPGGDLLNHNSDQILLMLAQKYSVTGHFSDASFNSASWVADTSNAIPYWVPVSNVNGTVLMPSSVQDVLKVYGNIQPADFTEIAGADLFANDPSGSAVPDPARFECAYSDPYEPGSPVIVSHTLSNTYSSKWTKLTQHSYQVSLKLSSGSFLKALGLTANASDALTFSNSSQSTNTTTNGTSMQLSLRQPTSSYSGPALLRTYIDKIYQTFMYSLKSPPQATPGCPI